MIKRCAAPCSGVVARGASRGESRRDVIRNVAAHRDGALPGGLVAAVAIGREIAGIVVVNVAG